MFQIEEAICNKFNIDPEALKTDSNQEQIKTFLKTIEGQVYSVLGVSVQFGVNSNG